MDINLELISYSDFKKKGAENIIKDVVKTKNKIVIINKKLRPEEEIELIEYAMKYTTGKDIKGIEIASISKDNENKSLWDKFKTLLGIDEGITLIGNATLIKQIKKSKGKALLKI